MASSIGPVSGQGYRRKRSNVRVSPRAGNARSGFGRRLRRPAGWLMITGPRRTLMTIARSVAGLLLAAGVAAGADPPVEKLDVRPRRLYEWTPPVGTPADQVKWVADRHKQYRDEFVKAYKAAKTEAQQEALYRTE